MENHSSLSRLEVNIKNRDTTFMFGFMIASDEIDVLTDETYVDMTVAQFNFVNGGWL